MTTRNPDSEPLHLQERGKGPPLVLLHGFPLDGRMWASQLEELSDQYRVIVPDLRGFGRSRSNQSFTIESLADDVHALLESIGALRCVLAGLSMGGYVALAYVKKYLSDLRGLALVDTKAEADSPQAREGRQKMIELVRTSGARAVADQMQPRMLSPDTIAHRPQQVRTLREVMESCPPETIERALAAMRDRPDYSGILPSVAVPTLIIVGESDAITPPDQAQAMARAIPKSEVVLIQGAGHMSPLEHPEQVNQALRRFLKGVGSRPLN